jgi:hypothetical protein
MFKFINMALSLSSFIHKITFFLVCLGFALVTQASVVDGIYTSVLQVKSQQSIDRQAAFNEALARVLLKASGDHSLLERQDILSRFYPAEQYVLSFSYRENPAYADYLKRRSESKNGSGSVAVLAQSSGNFAEASTQQDDNDQQPTPLPFLMEVNFSGKALEQAMLAHGVPIWGTVRPSLMMWVVLEEDGRRQLLGETAAHPLSEFFVREAGHFALPVLFPQADSSDLSVLTISDLWGLFPDAINRAKDRYRADGDLMVRVYKSLDKRWVANWQLLIGGERYAASMQVDQLHVLARTLLGEVTALISERFAIKADQIQADNRVRLVVTEVDSFQDYVDIQEFLEKLAPVKSQFIERIQGDALTLSIELNSSDTRFYEYLNLSGRFEKLSVLTHDAAVSTHSRPLEIEQSVIPENHTVDEMLHEAQAMHFRWIAKTADSTLE